MAFIERFNVCGCSDLDLLEVIFLGLGESVFEDGFDDSIHWRVDSDKVGEHGDYIGAVPPAGGVPKAAIWVVPFFEGVDGCFGLQGVCGRSVIDKTWQDSWGIIEESVY